MKKYNWRAQVAIILRIQRHALRLRNNSAPYASKQAISAEK